MSFAVTVKDAQDLRRLIPLNILSSSRFESLCAEVGIEEVPRGGVLFRQGDARNEFVYVLGGTVSLQAGGMELETITGGTESARFALAHQIPRKVSAVAKDRVKFIKVDAAYVNQPGESKSSGMANYEVSDMAADTQDDWVTTLLNSPIFQRLPPANLQNILSLLEEIPVKTGQEIVRQDEPGDYYYVIKRGTCALTRKPSRLAREIKLAELKTCDTFGEDSLISDQPRNVTVTMLTDGVLLRLSKANFLRLVKEPVIVYVNMDEALRMIQQGVAAWLDVRTTAEFQEGHLSGAVNIPFFQLRMELPRLNRRLKCILACETGRVSEAAAFLLIRQGFEAYVLKGGISGVFKDQLVAGPEGMARRPAGVTSEPPSNPPGAQEFVTSPAAISLEVEVPEAVEPVPSPAASFAPSVVEGSLELEEVAELVQGDGGGSEDLEAARSVLQELDELQRRGEGLEAELTNRLGVLSELSERLSNELSTVGESLISLKDTSSKRAASSEDADWQQRLALAGAERDALEVELRAALGESESRRATLQQELSALAEKLLAEQASAKARLETALAEKETAEDQRKTADDFRQNLEHARAELHRYESLSRDLEHGKKVAENRATSLQTQVDELRALVQEFVERQEQGEAGDLEQVESLTAELNTVRAQANEDVGAMQVKLRGAEREQARLRQELEEIRAQAIAEDVHGEASARGTTGQAEDEGWPAAKKILNWGMRTVYALLLIALGAIVTAALLLGTEHGRTLTSRLVSQIEQGQPLTLDGSSP